MTRLTSCIAAFVVFGMAGACASERAPRPSTSEMPRVAPVVDPVVDPVDPVVEHLRATRTAFARAANEPPEVALATLGALRARPVPPGLDADEASYLASEIDRELALVSLELGHVDEAVTAIERSLATTEAMTERDRAATAGLLLTAEAIYRRSGRIEAASWARREAALLVARDGGL